VGGKGDCPPCIPRVQATGCSIYEFSLTFTWLHSVITNEALEKEAWQHNNYICNEENAVTENYVNLVSGVIVMDCTVYFTT
jgi:hypothetical protein